jgi:hypothetical protein
VTDVSKDILRFGQNSRSDQRREPLRRDQLDPAFEAIFEQVEKSRKTVECLGARRKLHQQVDIAVGAGLTTQNRAEQCEPRDAKGPDLRLGRRGVPPPRPG